MLSPLTHVIAPCCFPCPWVSRYSPCADFNNIDYERNRKGDFCADTPVELNRDDDDILPGHCSTPQVASTERLCLVAPPPPPRGALVVLSTAGHVCRPVQFVVLCLASAVWCERSRRASPRVAKPPSPDWPKRCIPLLGHAEPTVSACASAAAPWFACVHQVVL